MIIWIIIFIFFVFFQAFFAGVETGLISINRIALKKLVEEGNTRAVFISYILDNIEEFLTVTLIGTNISIIATSVIASNKFLPYFENYFGAEIGKIVMSAFVITPIILLFAEILPKEIFRQKADTLVLRSSFLVRMSFYVFIVPSKIIFFIVKLILPKVENDSLLFSKDEIEHFIAVSDKSGVLEPGQKEMMEGIFDLSETNVKEIMTPRINVIALDVESTVQEVFDCVEEHGYSRVPVFGEDIDDIKGFVFVLDLLYDRGLDVNKESIKEYIREISFVPETKSIDTLFKEMKQSKEQIRMVIDEHGQISGLITQEDIIEEIVGEIHDEYDEETLDILENKDGTILVNAMLPVNELNEKYNFNLPEEDEYETFGGFLEHLTGVIPKEGQVIQWNNYKFRILKRNNNSIGIVEIDISNDKKIMDESENNSGE